MARAAHHPVVIIGAGPVGLTLALDLAKRGVKSVLLDDADRIGEGSRAICFAKRTLEIFDRLGVAAPILAKGVVWQKGRVFQGTREIYDFDLLPEAGHKMPAFINLQQYYVEKVLVDAVLARPELIDLRWRNKVAGVTREPDGVTVTIDTPDGPYAIAADWLAACDGARSAVRSMLGLEFKGEAFEDQFLIADIRMTAAFPAVADSATSRKVADTATPKNERWFWFDPPFHSGRSALLHKQPDDIWRIDLQLSPDADTEVERQPAQVRARVERMLGHADFELEWVSIYRFQCRRLERFVHGSVIFAGDSAHQVSPFGARGANSGVQDADNLGWKLAAVIKGAAPARLIETYDVERGEAADENILNSTRATDFIAPRSLAELRFRDAALHLAQHADFAKRFVNSGRLSLPTSYGQGSGPSTIAGVAPGAPLPDAPLQTRDGKRVWLLDLLGGEFTIISVDGDCPPIDLPGVKFISAGEEFIDCDGLAAPRLTGGGAGTVLVRPDGHVAARSQHPKQSDILAAMRVALAEP